MSDKRFAGLLLLLLSLSAVPAIAAQSCNNNLTITAPNGRYIDPGAAKAQCWGARTHDIVSRYRKSGQKKVRKNPST